MTPEDFQRFAEEARLAREQKPAHVKVCMAAGCMSCGSEAVLKALQKEGGGEVQAVGCLGLCAEGPLVTVDGTPRVFEGIRPEDAPALLAVARGGTAPGLASQPKDQPFYAWQKRIVLENFERIDPEKLEDYVACEGYAALLQALTTMKPAQVVEQVVKSGLRGRGGGGYPTGLKWSTVAKSPGAKKYVICNADEGDPGAFMDRSVLESDPHRVLEGMAIAGYAVGADEGYVYVRAEYPLAVKRLKQAIQQAEKRGLLGQNLLQTGFSFKVNIRLGAGAFVCGEETALMASIEGKRGQPRPRPPFPAEAGLWGCPTLINNVETFANIPPILRNGGDWYASIGTEKSKGTKVFALAGRINRTGLIEVPMGITLRQIVYDIGGGIPEGRKFKAVQTGGPSGGCLPSQFLDMPVDYDGLIQAGSIMGSGGMIVMDETSCMVDVAKFFMEFCRSESCGKCVPCRVGTAQMHDILVRITSGTATMRDLDLLQEIGDMVRNTSLCGLGQTAPNPVTSTLRYFRDEYLAHIEDKRCPADVCRMQPAEVHA